MKPTVAIVGAGLAGLATGFFLSKTYSVTVFDKKGIGGGASGIAAGLLHPFVGQTGKLNTLGWEGMEASLALLSGHILHKGLFRIPFTAQMEKGFASNSAFKAVEGGFWQEEAYAIDIMAYLQFLMGKIEANGGRLIIQKIEDPHQLKFDKIILCQGWETPFTQITPVKGQLIEIGCTFPYPISAEGYLLPQKNSSIIGSTYERGYTSTEPDTSCLSELLSKAEKMMPGISKYPILNIRSGVRASSPHRLPTIEKIDSRLHVYTGLGSRGLLYHVLFAKKLLEIL